MDDQTPLAVESPKCAPQPSFEASVNSWNSVLKRVKTLTFQHIGLV